MMASLVKIVKTSLKGTPHLLMHLRLISHTLHLHTDRGAFMDCYGHTSGP